MAELKKDLDSYNSFVPLVSDLKKSSVFGNYIEINLLLENEKVCTYDCLYCDLGPTNIKINQIKKLVFPSLLKVSNELSKKYYNTILVDQTIDTILISGNGDASSNPNFIESARGIKSWLNDNISQANFSILTNGSNFNPKKIRSMNEIFDEVFLKIDAQNETSLKNINRPINRQNMEKIIYVGQSIENCSTQTVFFDGKVNNISDSFLEEWFEILSLIRPKKIILSTVSENINGVKPVDDIFLYNLERKIKNKLSSEVFVII